jgi:hypothetical protein
VAEKARCHADTPADGRHCISWQSATQKATTTAQHPAAPPHTSFQREHSHTAAHPPQNSCPSRWLTASTSNNPHASRHERARYQDYAAPIVSAMPVSGPAPKSATLDLLCVSTSSDSGAVRDGGRGGRRGAAATSSGCREASRDMFRGEGHGWCQASCANCTTGA